MYFTVILINYFLLSHNVIKSCEEIELDVPFEPVGSNYSGEKFPMKYLSLENTTSSEKDLKFYVTSLKKIVDIFSENFNNTDPNLTLGMYFVKGILKRTLRDYNYKLQNVKALENVFKKIINAGENVVSHFKFKVLYSKEDYDFPDDDRRKLYYIFNDDAPLVYSIRTFNRGKLTKWLFSNKHVHNYSDQFDDATLPKETYINFMYQMAELYPVEKSDECFVNTVNSPEPIKMNELRRCRPNPECKEAALATPSYAYVISHRLLYILSHQLIRRCYVLETPELDDLYMELLCANMYRELVYMARRGYFARDMFLEHISLCALFGYEEFHRRHWFLKAASWVNEYGCVKENINTDIIYYNIYLKQTTDPKKIAKIREFKKKNLNSECHKHPMALAMFTLVHGIRHALHFVSKSSLETINWDLVFY